MGIFGSLFGTKPAASGQHKVQAQLPEVEAVLKRCIVDFQDRTKLSYVLVFPVMHKIAVKLFVEDFGAEAALKHYEYLVASVTSGGVIREDQFKNFEWPDGSPQDASLVLELDALLWNRARDLIAQGFLKETVVNALMNTALVAASKGLSPFISAGYLITVAKELRAGLHTPSPEVRPKAAEDTDEATTKIFDNLRDTAYTFKEHSGLEWQHLLPGMQRVFVIYVIKYRGKAGALELFHKQVNALAPLLDQCVKNPPQTIPITPLHIKNMATFNDLFQQNADTFIEIPEVHPVLIAHALSMLITQLASTHYDLVFLSAILDSSRRDVEQGKYDFVKKTH